MLILAPGQEGLPEAGRRCMIRQENPGSWRSVLRNRWVRVAIYILAMALPMGAACAAILRVGPDAGDDFATIQAAVDAAVNGDIIDIAFGFYDEQIVIVGKDLSLRGPGQNYAGNQKAFLLPTSLPANAVTPGGRSIHAALVLEQAHVNLRFLSIFGLSLPSGTAPC